MADDRPTRKLDLGPTGKLVAANVREVRLSQQLTIAQVSEMLTAYNWPLNVASLSRIETGSRRVDVDDLMAIARALSVTPLRLLLPLTDAPYDVWPFTGMGAEGSLDKTPTVRQQWQWATGVRPLWRQDLDTDEFVRKASRDHFRLLSMPIWPIDPEQS